ncbi:aldehyde dehydrogenase family protein [Mycobacterium sp. NPDC003449]
MPAADLVTVGAGHGRIATDTAAVVEGLRANFRSRSPLDLAWRVDQLNALERFLKSEEHLLAEALSDDLGRNEFDTVIGDFGSVRTEIAEARRNLTRWSRRRRVRLPFTLRPGKAFYLHEPLGVVLVIGPWNVPVYLTLGPLVGAISAGCSAVIKPSEHAPRTSSVLAEQLPRYLDPRAFAVVEGDGTTTQALIQQGLDHVFFTGGGPVGRAIMAAAAEKMTPVTLELGGKSPVLVAGDADLRSAGRRIAFTKLFNAGQTCVAPDYVLVEEGAAEAFIESVTHWMKTFTERLAGGSAQRIVNEAHTRRLAALLSGHGGRTILGGNADVGKCRVEPTVVVDPDPSAPLMQEEIFGPVLPILVVKSVQEAIDFIGRRPHPLAAYLFTDRSDVREAFITQVHSGGIVINQLLLHVGVPTLPFGGVGPSGIGAYHGRFGFETFSHRKSILVKPSRPDPSVMYPPYGRAKLALLRRLV